MEESLGPLKRDRRLYRLSHDHHTGLVFAWRLKQGVANDASDNQMRSYIAYFWDNDLKRHFRDEEKLLLPHLASSDPIKIQTLQEHHTIRELVHLITSKEDIRDQVQQLSRMIHDHIRFEERQLFPYLEKALSASQLNNIGKELTIAPEFCDKWEHQFWK